MKNAEEVNNAAEKERMARWCKLWCLGRDDRRPTRSSDFDRICAGRSVVPLQFRPPSLVFSSESSPGRSDAGKSDPVVEFGEKCTDGGGLVCGRGERKKKRSQDRGPRRRGLRTQRKHGELTAVWGNTKLRSEAASKALGR
ncbi:hypothetical protein TRIATDRAFT_301201, partial [Trichoderma atroviride IMI 206040]